MFSKLIKSLHRNTAVRLSLHFSLLFLLSALVLFVTVDYLLKKSQTEKDQQLISSFIESYQRLHQQVGLHKLELVIGRDAPYFQRSEMRVMLEDGQGKQLMLVQPESWYGELQFVAPTDSSDWQAGHLQGSAIRVLFRQVELNDGVVLRVAKSVVPGETQLASYRLLVLQVMVPLLLLGLLLTVYMNWRALRPVHDLIATVRSIQANQLKARVEVRNPESELGELAGIFNEMLEQIERLILGMQQSLDSVAHDLRTPLSRMRLSLEAALTKPDEQSLKEALMDCGEEGAQVEAMLRALMDLSEAESGIMKLHPETLNLSQLIRDCIDLYHYVAEDKSIEVLFADEQDCFITADPMRLRQVMANLLDNAVKYTPSGGTVSLGIESVDQRVKIIVTDTGIGIDEQDQSLVFDRLYRADSSRSETGMGLGLSMVRAVVQAHQGNISLESTIGQGSCFRIELPVNSAAGGYQARA
ncbi:MAG: HAMP domain-containing histidine kinase [Amphritea sp.]|nr:HAMP domain-containing histidine kinase [Amphritea sp.]